MAIPSWLNISQLSGSGDTIITITASTLEGLVERTTTLRVSGNTKYVDVEVTQAPHDYAEDYLTFEITSDGVINWTLSGYSSAQPLSIEYRLNGGEWTQITASRSGATNFNVVAGDVVEFRGDNPAYADTNGASTFARSTAGFKASGNLMSLVSSVGFENITALSEDRTFSTLFGSCTGLTDARNLVLPATALTEYCYNGMFDLCRSLVYPPKLPATTLAPYCYHDMFDGCYSLTTAPELPATVMQTSCYDGMFANCTGLTSAPALPATTLAMSCYYGMFKGCTSLTTAPALPATTLASSCYVSMFEGCTSLTASPVLPAPTMVGGCYTTMFYGCSNLSRIECYATNPSVTGTWDNPYTRNWVDGVAASGTFVKAPTATWEIGVNGIPTSWVSQDIDDDSYNYLTFTITGAGDINWKKSANATTRSIQYSKNGGTWTTLTPDSVGVKIYSLVPGDVVRFRGSNATYQSNSFGDTTAQFTVKGNIMSLIYSDDFVGKDSFQSGTTNNFAGLFSGVTGLTSVESLVLPATGLTQSCYASMFRDCVNLTKPIIELPATIIEEYSYRNMFRGCSSITTAPEICGTSLTNGCYTAMFEDCSSLVAAPDLPATKVYMYCYDSMFAYCTSLVNPPTMGMTTIDSYGAGACQSMFNGCTSLVRSPHLKPTELYSFNGIGCYGYMFAGCSSLTRIDCDAVSLMPSSSGSTLADALVDWVSGVGSSGTFYKNPNATSWSTGSSGIPSGWSVVDAT